MTENSAWMNNVLEALQDGDPNILDTILNKKREATKAKELNALVDGTSVLHIALGNAECLKVLLQHGARPSKKDKNDLLHVAVKEDYVESMMILCNYGADINAKLTVDDKTPLQIAAEQNSAACYDLLHLLGAHMPEKAIDDLLKNERKQDYLIIQQGYKDKKIRNVGATVNVTDRKFNIKDRFAKPIGIIIENPREAFNILVCRMEPEYQSICMRIPKVEVPDGASLISDIYQYKVDKDVECGIYIDLLTPVNNKYKEIIVLQKLYHVYDDDSAIDDVIRIGKHVNNKQVFVRNFCLKTGRSCPIVAIAVFVRNKIDTTTIKPDKTTVFCSTKEPEFELRAEPGSDLSNKRIEMQVVEADSSDDSRESGIGSHSDFCSIKSFETSSSVSTSGPLSAASTSRPQAAPSTSSMGYKVIVTLPKPENMYVYDTPEDQCHVMTCEQVDTVTPTAVLSSNIGSTAVTTQSDEHNWNEHKNVEKENRRIKVLNAKEGNFIVIMAQRITEFIKEKVKAMWESANGCKKSCRVFATVEPVISTRLTPFCKFLVKVHLCLEKDYPKKCIDILRENIRLPTNERSVKSSSVVIEMNIKLTYIYKLDIIHGEFKGAKKMPVQYQEGRDKTKQFEVSTEDKLKVSGVVNISKASIVSFSKPKKLPVEFVPRKVHTNTGEIFLNDDYVENELAEKIGRKWFTFGIYLGMPFVKLETYEDADIFETYGQYISGEQRLDTFIKATFEAEMPTLREELLENHMLKYEQTDQDIKTWVTKYKTKIENGKMHFDFLPLKSKGVSPFDDTFFVFVAKCKTFDEMDVVRLEVDTKFIRKQTRNIPHYVTCKILSMFKDQCQGQSKFLKKLMEYLKTEGRNLTILEITAGVKIWMDTCPDREQDKKLIRSIFK